MTPCPICAGWHPLMVCPHVYRGPVWLHNCPHGPHASIRLLPGVIPACPAVGCGAPLLADQLAVDGHAAVGCEVCGHLIGCCGAAYIAAGVERALEHAHVGERPPQ